MDELSDCIDQLEAEVDSCMCNRRVGYNGQPNDNSSSSRNTSSAPIGCMKCHKDNAYEQVTTLIPVHPCTST